MQIDSRHHRTSGECERHPRKAGKIEDMQQIVSYGVMSTPSVVIDGKVVHSGGIPTRDKVEEWLSA